MRLKDFKFLLLLMSVTSGIELLGQASKASRPEPEILSVFPLTGKQGTAWEVEVRGSGVEEAYGVWFDCDSLRALVKAIQPIDLDPEKPASAPNKGSTSKRGQRITLEVQAGSSSAQGLHMFRLISNSGVSNALSINITDEKVAMEENERTRQDSGFQRVSWPSVVVGRVSKEGEVDYYEIQVQRGQTLLFEADSLGGQLDPVLTLFEQTGSWLNAGRLVQLAFDDDLGSRSAAAISYRFKHQGNYVVGVAGFVGLGGPDFSYQLRITERSTAGLSDLLTKGTSRPAHPSRKQWQERDFARDLEPTRLDELGSRTVQVPTSQQKPLNSEGNSESKPTSDGTPKSLEQAKESVSVQLPILQLIKEREPNDRVPEALDISIPAIIQGAIGRPGDVDCYRIRAESGRAMVFEIQAEGAGPPLFSPRLEVWTTSGEEVLNNVYQRIGGDGDDWVQSLEPKVIYTFDRSGEYHVRLRDLTSRNGSPDFVYRLLVRDQIPHVGEVRLAEDRVNLIKGKSRKIAISADQEEGFDGQIAVRVEDLPPGVAVLPAADIAPAQGPPFAKVHPERFVPKNQIVTLILLADERAEVTKMPIWTKVKVQPIVSGQVGKPFSVRDLGIMVVDSSPTTPPEGGNRNP